MVTVKVTDSACNSLLDALDAKGLNCTYIEYLQSINLEQTIGVVTYEQYKLLDSKSTVTKAECAEMQYEYNEYVNAYCTTFTEDTEIMLTRVQYEDLLYQKESM